MVGDMNVADEFFDLSQKHIKERYDAASDDERIAFMLLLSLNEKERATAVAMEWGYISLDGTVRKDLT